MQNNKSEGRSARRTAKRNEGWEGIERIVHENGSNMFRSDFLPRCWGMLFCPIVPPIPELVGCRGIIGARGVIPIPEDDTGREGVMVDPEFILPIPVFTFIPKPMPLFPFCCHGDPPMPPAAIG